MKKIEAIIRPSRLEEVKEALKLLNLGGLTITQVMGCGRQQGYTEVFRGNSVDINVLQKIRVEIVVPDAMAESVIDSIIEAARIGEIGDGKIFISDIQEAIRIRTGERGNVALQA